jgi:hypothetical protein
MTELDHEILVYLQIVLLPLSFKIGAFVDVHFLVLPFVKVLFVKTVVLDHLVLWMCHIVALAKYMLTFYQEVVA